MHDYNTKSQVIADLEEAISKARRYGKDPSGSEEVKLICSILRNEFGIRCILLDRFDYQQTGDL